MAEWSQEASEYLDGYLKQIAVLVRRQGDDVDEVITGLRDHITNEMESDGTATVSVDRLLSVLSDLGSVEEVAGLDIATLKSTTAARETPPNVPSAVPPAVPRVSKSVVIHRHRSPASCVIAIILAIGAAFVGLAVLGIIASIMLPAVSRSREAARRATCQNNLKQIGLSLIMRGAEHNDQLPSIDLNYSSVMFDIDAIFPEFASDFEVLICPSGPHAGVDVSTLNDEYTFDFDYIFVSHVIASEAEAIGYLDAVAEAKRTDTPLNDDIVLNDGSVLPRIQFGTADRPESEIPLLIERPGHHFPDGYNVLFLDGRVEYGRVGSDDFLWSQEFSKALEGAGVNR